MNLRPYLPEDWQRLCLIHDAARMYELRASGLAEALLTLEQTARGEGLFDEEVAVAQIENEVCGFMAFSEGELSWLYVDPARCKQGIGRHLLRHAINASAGRMSTEVLVGNDVALALYLSEGFKVGRRVDGKLTGNEAFSASDYVLQRTPSEA
jgi:ribosomal protein S18 acetylase RimI-like enzyme